MSKGKKLTAKELEEKLEKNAIERRKMFERLCRHVEMGLSLESFGEIHQQTIERYFKTHSSEFSRTEFDIAMQRGRQAWERLGLRQASGDCLGNSRTWFYNMSNRYGWSDKQKIEAEHSGQVAINIVSYASNKSKSDT